MPGFHAEMRDVDQGGGVIGLNAKDGISSHGLQAFADFQNGQGAQKAQRIKVIIIGHRRELGVLLQFVHAYVSTQMGDGRAKLRYVGCYV